MHREISNIEIVMPTEISRFWLASQPPFQHEYYTK